MSDQHKMAATKLAMMQGQATTNCRLHLNQRAQRCYSQDLNARQTLPPHKERLPPSPGVERRKGRGRNLEQIHRADSDGGTTTVGRPWPCRCTDAMASRSYDSSLPCRRTSKSLLGFALCRQPPCRGRALPPPCGTLRPRHGG